MIGVVGPSSQYGADIPLAVIGIVMKVFGIVIAFSVGIAVGGQPIVGYNYGCGNLERVKKVYKLVILANLIVGAIATVLFEVCPQAIVSIFGSESDLYNEYARLCFRIFLGGILLCCVQKASSIFSRLFSPSCSYCLSFALWAGARIIKRSKNTFRKSKTDKMTFKITPPAADIVCGGRL